MATYSQLLATYKILLVGDSGVGKSTFLNTIVGGSNNLPTLPTILVDHHTVNWPLDPDCRSSVNLQFWDTGGQERFRSLTRSFYRGAHGVLLMFDMSDHESFRHLSDYWLGEVATNCCDMLAPPSVVIVGNKSDSSSIQVDCGRALADLNRCRYMETSGKYGTRVKETIDLLVYKMVESAERLRRERAQLDWRLRTAEREKEKAAAVELTKTAARQKRRGKGDCC